MYLFIECWKARQEWITLSQADRADYLTQVSGGVGDLIKAGVEIVSWSMNDKNTSNRGDYDCFAVWKFPNKEIALQFEQIVEQSGWYNYFDQVNFKGSLSDPQSIIEAMIKN